MPWAIAATVAGSVISGAIASSGSSKAADTQVNNAGKGIALQEGAYNASKAQLSPWRTAGMNALEMLSKSLGVDTGAGFTESPGYKFAMEQGVRAVDAGAANKGLIGSGARAKALTEFGQGIANQEYYNYKKLKMEELFNTQNRLSDMSRTGAAAAGGMASAAMHTADMSSKLYAGIGQAKADNAANQANIWGDVASDVSGGFGGGGMASYNAGTGDWTTGSGGFPSSGGLDSIFKMQW